LSGEVEHAVAIQALPKQRQLRAKTTSENAGVQYLPVGFEATGVFGGYLRKDFPSCQGANRE